MPRASLLSLILVVFEPYSPRGAPGRERTRPPRRDTPRQAPPEPVSSVRFLAAADITGRLQRTRDGPGVEEDERLVSPPSPAIIEGSDATWSSLRFPRSSPTRPGQHDSPGDGQRPDGGGWLGVRLHSVLPRRPRYAGCAACRDRSPFLRQPRNDAHQYHPGRRRLRGAGWASPSSFGSSSRRRKSGAEPGRVT